MIGITVLIEMEKMKGKKNMQQNCNIIRLDLKLYLKKCNIPNTNCEDMIEFIV